MPSEAGADLNEGEAKLGAGADTDRFSGHPVRLQIFEGPLDLLLYLIRAHRCDIADIPIEQVTTQFMEFLQLMDEVNLEYAGDFLVTAATLMQIKARMLLPRADDAGGDEAAEEEGLDPRQELVERLLEYQRMKEAALNLADLREQRSLQFARPPVPVSSLDNAAPQLVLDEISSFDLLRALQRVLLRMAERPVALVRRDPFSLSERVQSVLNRLGSGSLTFAQLCEDCESRLEVVITFLALLELIRRHRIEVLQKKLFDDIQVKLAVPPKPAAPSPVVPGNQP